MRSIAKVSWRTAVSVAVGWVVACLLAGAIAMSFSLRSLVIENSTPSGGFAAVGIELSGRAAIMIFGPPVALLLFRLVAPRFASHAER